jgi:hypothetical protein
MQLDDPNRALWSNLRDFCIGVYYCSPLFLILAVVVGSFV